MLFLKILDTKGKWAIYKQDGVASSRVLIKETNTAEETLYYLRRLMQSLRNRGRHDRV